MILKSNGCLRYPADSLYTFNLNMGLEDICNGERGEYHTKYKYVMEFYLPGQIGPWSFMNAGSRFSTVAFHGFMCVDTLLGYLRPSFELISNVNSVSQSTS